MSDSVPKHPVLVDIAIGLFAGLVATQVTNFAQGPLKWVTPDGVARREKEVRPGASSSLVAAKTIAQAVDISPLSKTRSCGVPRFTSRPA